MESFEKRYLSFSKFAVKIPHSLMACAFFTADTPTSVHCYFCKKTLDGWNQKDVPILEHLTHNNGCPMFALNSFDGRNATYPPGFNKEKQRDYAKQGFVYYKLKESSGYDLFCFRCGFYVNERVTHEKNHYAECKKKKRNGNFAFENKHGIFINDLLAGRVRLSDYCFKNIYVPDQYKEEFGELIDVNEGVFDETVDVLRRSILSNNKWVDEVMDKEIENILANIDNKFDAFVDKMKMKQ